jgi:hypothetical protein
MDGQTRPLNTALVSHFKFHPAKVKHCLLLLTKIPSASKFVLLVCMLKLIQPRLRYKTWTIVQMLFEISNSVSMRSTLTFCAIWYSREHKFLFEADNGQLRFEWPVELLRTTRNDTMSAFCPQLVCFLRFICSLRRIFKYVVWIKASCSKHYAWRI